MYGDSVVGRHWLWVVFLNGNGKTYFILLDLSYDRDIFCDSCNGLFSLKRMGPGGLPQLLLLCFGNCIGFFGLSMVRVQGEPINRKLFLLSLVIAVILLMANCSDSLISRCVCFILLVSFANIFWNLQENSFDNLDFDLDLMAWETGIWDINNQFCTGNHVYHW